LELFSLFSAPGCLTSLKVEFKEEIVLKPEKILIPLVIIAVGIALSGCVEFVSPTPANNSILNVNHFEVNVSVSSEANIDLSSFIFNWNGTGYTLYDGSLALMMNFNNNSIIGESPTLAIDISPYRNFGIIHGAVYVDGRYGKALNFDGNDDYVEVTNEEGLPSGAINTSLNGNLTVMAWIKKPSQDYWFDSIVTTEAFRFQIDSGRKIHWGWTDGVSNSLVDSNTTITLNEWHHVVGVKEGTTIKFYIDGKPAGSGTISATRNVSSMRIGVDGLSGIGAIDYFNGVIDDVKIYNRALTPEEISLHYRSTFWRHNMLGGYFYASITDLPDGTYSFYAVAYSGGNAYPTMVRYVTIGLENPIKKPKPHARPFMIESKYFRAEQIGLRKRIPANETAEFMIKLKNLDDEPMKIEIKAIQSRSTPGNISINTTPEITLNPLEETTIPVEITPHEKGSYIITVTVTCPDAPYNRYDFTFVVDAY